MTAPVVAVNGSDVLVSPDVVIPQATGVYSLPVNKTGTICLGAGDLSKLGSHCEIEFTPPSVCAESAVGARLVGWSTAVCHVLRSCPCNVHNALCGRHGAKRVNAVTRSFDASFAALLPVMERLVPEYKSSLWLDDGKWISKWPTGKQKAIASSMLYDKLMPGRVKAMIKREIYHSMPSRARLIQFYANLRTQAEFGPQFYALQDVIAHEFRNRDIGNGIDVTIACGMNADEIGAWMQAVMERNPYGFYERDGKNWDSTMSREHASFKRRIYDLFDVELSEFVASCEDVKGGAAIKDMYYKYKMLSTVKSGHNDTTLGNSLINAAIVIEALIALGLRGSILVMGDDVLVAIYDRFDSLEIVNIEKCFGIQPEARTRGGRFNDPERVTFISGCWMFDGVYRFCPIPGRLIARTWWTVNDPGVGEKLQAYRRAVSLGLMASCGNMPVIRVFLRKFLTPGDKIGRSDKGYVYRTVSNGLVDGMAAFCKRYEVNEAQVLACEAWLEFIPAEPYILCHPMLTRMSEVDGAEIEDRFDSAPLGEHLECV